MIKREAYWRIQLTRIAHANRGRSFGGSSVDAQPFEEHVEPENGGYLGDVGLEVPQVQVADTQTLVKQTMARAAAMSVPLVVEGRARGRARRRRIGYGGPIGLDAQQSPTGRVCELLSKKSHELISH